MCKMLRSGLEVCIYVNGEYSLTHLAYNKSNDRRTRVQNRYQGDSQR